MKKFLVVVIALIIIVAGMASYFLSHKGAGSSGQNSANQKTGFFSSIFPSSGDVKNTGDLAGGQAISSGGSTEGNNPRSGKNSSTNIIFLPEPKQITKDPISGFIAFSTSTIRYMEKSTGYIYEVDLDGKNYNRLSNTTLLKTQRTLWAPKGNKLIISYLNGSIKNFSAVLPTGTTTDLTGSYFPAVRDIAVSSSGEKVFYTQKNGNKTDGIFTNFEDNKKKLVFSMPFGEFNLGWPSENIITLLSRPSGSVPGYFYSIDLKTNLFSKIMGGVNGLSASLSPKGDFVFYAKSNGGDSFSGSFLDTKTGAELNYAPSSFPEKCVWSKNNSIILCAVPKAIPRATYPDDWYKGKVMFNDRLWQINVPIGETNVLHDNLGGEVDAVNLQLDPEETYLGYVNKRDGTLWVARFR